MVNWNTGSFADAVFNYYDSVPSGFSGTNLTPVIERKIIRVEEYTGNTIGTTGILPKFQDAILYFVLAEVSRGIDGQGSDVMSIKLGPMNVKKGASSANSNNASFYEQEAVRIMNEEIGYDSKFEQVFG